MKSKGKLVDEYESSKGIAISSPVIHDLAHLLAQLDGEPESGLKEEDFQISLSRHTRYLNLPAILHHGVLNKWIFSKFELANRNVTDFLYIVPTSTQNTAILVEIESPQKPFWKNSERPVQSKEFAAAIAQVREWKAELENPDLGTRANLTAALKRFFGNPLMAENPWVFEYVLIYGRSKDNIGNAKRAAMFNQIRTELGGSKIHLLTFDQMVSGASEGKTDQYNIVKFIGPYRQASYAYINVKPRDFARLGPDVLKLSAEEEELFRFYGYQIDEWKSGKLLAAGIDGTHAAEPEEISDDILARLRSSIAKS